MRQVTYSFRGVTRPGAINAEAEGVDLAAPRTALVMVEPHKRGGSPMRRSIAVVLAITFLSGCAFSAQPQGGSLTAIRPGTDRQQVVAVLGQPPRSQIVNGKPVLDSYACEPDGQIVAVRMSPGWLVAEYILTLGIAGLVDTARYSNLQQRINECDVRYDADGKVSGTSSIHGLVVQSQ